MQVTPSGGLTITARTVSEIYLQCKLLQLVEKLQDMNTIIFSQKTGFKQKPRTEFNRENSKKIYHHVAKFGINTSYATFKLSDT